jgi:predicted Zn-dependent protease with MMP-like domain
LLERIIAELPPGIARLLDEVPVIVLDEPTEAMVRDLGDDPSDPASYELCGLHSGFAITEASVEHSGEVPPEIHLFRRGIILAAGGLDGDDADERVAREIRTTLLHEIGHQFGLDEDDLDRLGFA